MSDFVTVARFADVPENGLIGVVADDRPIVLVNREGTIYALEDRCSHEEFPLSSGDVASGEITCVLHGARFDIETGQPRALPAVMPVRTYEVRVEGDDIQVNLGD
ncbi:MAG: non-heme iron oxygenase ferredoxin subunit [Gemmatimonadota bacterium]|nr:non-heme iron oxygenase ferredoxin subunit [Gemmatimonadota bacterium]